MDEPNVSDAGGVEPSGDTGFVSQDGTFNDGWTGREEFKANADTLSRYKNVTDLANSHMELRRKFGKDPNSMAEIPNETSSDDVKAAWRKANDIPETVDEYKYDYSDDFATKLGPLDDKKMASVKEFAHKELGLSNARFQKLMDFYHTNISGDIDASSASFEEQKQTAFDNGMAILNREWLEGTEDRTSAALEFLQKHGEFEVRDKEGNMVNPLEMLFAEAPGLKTSPWLAMIADNMAQAMNEDTLHGGQGSSTATSLEGINTQIADLRSEQSAIRAASPVNYKNDPKFKDNERRMKLLYQKKPA